MSLYSIFGYPKLRLEKFFMMFFSLLTIGLVSCTIEDLPELSIESVSIYAAPDANQNSAIAVDLVLIYNQELLKTIGQMSASKYFASSKQLLLDNPSLLDIWRWELIPGQLVSNFEPPQDKGNAFGAYVFANYLTPGDHRVRVAPNGIVNIILLRDDLKNLDKSVTNELHMGTTVSNVSNFQEGVEAEDLCQLLMGSTSSSLSCQRRAPKCCPPAPRARATQCMPPVQGKPIQIITHPLNPPPAVPPQPCRKLR